MNKRVSRYQLDKEHKRSVFHTIIDDLYTYDQMGESADPFVERFDWDLFTAEEMDQLINAEVAKEEISDGTREAGN